MIYKNIEIIEEPERFNRVCKCLIPSGFYAVVPHSVLGFLKLCGDSIAEVKSQIEDYLKSDLSI